MLSSKFSSNCVELLKDEKFRALKSNEYRIVYLLAKVKSIQEFRDEIFNTAEKYYANHCKSLERSVSLRIEGSNYYEMQDYGNSIYFFSHAILNAPFPTISDECSELSFAYSSRSTVWFLMENYENALFDANQSLKLKPTVEMVLHKVYCLRHLKRFEDAKQLIEEVLDNQDMYAIEGKQEILNQLIELQGIVDNEFYAYGEKDEGIEEPEYPSFDYNLWIDNKCSFEITPEKGRHLMAKEFVPKNCAVFMEKAQNVLLMSENLMTHCSNCLKNIGYKFWPCIWCNEVVFCDQRCADQAITRFHQYECGITGLLCRQINRACHQTFRIITSIGCENAFQMYKSYDRNEFDIKEWIAKHESFEENEKSKPRLEMLEEFKAMLTLLDHNEEHSMNENIKHTFFAIETAVLLEYRNAYKCKDTKIFISFINFLILQMRKVLTNNFGWVEMDPKNMSLPPNHIANCICIMGSFINHSCSPNVFWSFIDGKIRFQAIKDINAGEEICITYGPNETFPFKVRQQTLRTRYFFSCHCSLCLKDVKTVPALQCLKCEGPVIYDNSTANQSCFKCGQKYQNIRRAMNKLGFLRLSFDRMVKNIENHINPYLSLRKAEELFEVIKSLVYSESDQLLALNKCLSRLHGKFGDYSNAVKHGEHSLPSIASLKSYKECYNLDDLLFMTNAYYMLLKDEKIEEKDKWKNCFDLFSVLLRHFKSLRNNCGNPEELPFHIKSMEVIEAMKRTKKIQFKQLKQVYGKLFIE